MRHRGRCYRNSPHHPSVSEGFASTEAGRQLIFDEYGEYRGEDSAVFLDVVVSDNDVNAPRNLIREQHDIIGEPADGIAEHIPDIGHVIKDCNNELYRIREKDPSFRGVNLLENNRIRAIMADVLSAFVEYNPILGDKKARKKCLKRIDAVVMHHCGDHSKCKWSDVCGYTKIKTENPSWTEAQIHAEHAKTGRFHGKAMGLSHHGIAVLKRVLFKRFDGESIDRVARCLSSNPAEAFFGICSKFSQGKRLNLEHTDLWKSMVFLGLCRSGNIERTHEQISALLNLDVLAPEKRSMETWKRVREKNYERNSGEPAKKRRHEAKALKDQIMMKQDAKKRHASGKVSVKQSAAVKKRRMVSCGACKQDGHNRTACPMPSLQKPIPNVDLLDCCETTPQNTHKLRGKRFEPDLVDWST